MSDYQFLKKDSVPWALPEISDVKRYKAVTVSDRAATEID
jgi:hypothetical protein